MSSLFEKDKPIFQSIRDTLFGDEPLEKVATYAKGSNDGSPWAHFAAAYQMLEKGNRPDALLELNKVLETPGLEARVYLQAWHCLRALGSFPPADVASRIQGMVVEAALDQGLDLVAAYADHSARYFNFSGAGVIWDISTPEMDKLIDELLAIGQGIISQIGLWDQPRPPAPPRGSVRINLLTYGGLYFGQGEFEALASDRLGGPALSGAFALMQALIAQQAA